MLQPNIFHSTIKGGNLEFILNVRIKIRKNFIWGEFNSCICLSNFNKDIPLASPRINVWMNANEELLDKVYTEVSLAQLH